MNGTQFLKGLVIILIGIILLLNNLTILNWSVWNNILRLWPLLLVSLGISLIFRRRLAWLAPLVILAGMIIGVSASYMGVDLHLEGKIEYKTETIQKEIEIVPLVQDLEKKTKTEEEIISESITEIEDEQVDVEGENVQKASDLVSKIQKANLHLNYDVGAFILEFPTPLLYQCEVNYIYPEFKPIEVYSILNNEASIHIHHSPISEQQIRNPKNRIDLKLNKDIVYDILVETGATTIDFDFSKFKIEKCTIQSGASDINIIAPQYHADIDINSGVSKIDITIPSNVGTAVRLDTGLSMKNLDNHFQKQENNVYISENFNNSEYQININIDSGLSQINIHYQ